MSTPPFTANPYPGRVRRVVSPVLVAREAELALLAATGARAAAGETGIVLVGGEAGVGKTRVVSEAARRLEADGFRVVPGWCVELGGDALPLAPLIDVVRTLERSLPPRELDDVLGPARPVLARLLPELAPGTAEGGELQPSRLFELVLGMLGRSRRSRRSPATRPPPPSRTTGTPPWTCHAP